LHAHLPWLKGAGKWPFGEEWLYQAMLDTYLPLLDLLARLRTGGVRGAITLGITPVLIEMLRDRDLIAGFDAYLDSRVELLEEDIVSFGNVQPALRQLAIGARAAIQNMRKHWQSAYERDLVGAFAEFARSGEIEIITSAATHAYLPLLDSTKAVEAQLATGLEVSTKAFGTIPAGIWLPECGFDPSVIPVLERLGLKFFYADERAAKDLTGNLDQPFRYPDSTVAFFVRHPMARGELMDTDLGYPGNSWYREFYKRHNASGMRYWRVTSRDASLGEKEAYEPARALEQIRLHAADFCKKIESIKRESSQAYLTFTFDAELFGHWWGEGIWWLEETLVQLQHDNIAQFVSPSAYLRAGSEPEVLALPRSSWGVGGDDRIWANAKTADYWEKVHAAQRRFEELANSADVSSALFTQAARELFLLQSSDWPFMISNGNANGYPRERIESHAERFAQLNAALRDEPADAQSIQDALENDTLFEDLRLDVFQTAGGAV
jgi:1,4-alpha-glucan branching enzyme